MKVKSYREFLKLYLPKKYAELEANNWQPKPRRVIVVVPRPGVKV